MAQGLGAAEYVVDRQTTKSLRGMGCTILCVSLSVRGGAREQRRVARLWRMGFRRRNLAGETILTASLLPKGLLEEGKL